MKKLKIYLAALEHDWEKVGTWVMPLGVACVGSYLKKFYPNEIEIKLFKKPTELIQAIKSDKPDLVGLSYYCWVKQLNKQVFEIVKEYSPATLTVGGGPEFSSLNANTEGALEFFTKQRACDVFVVDSGEIGFKNVVDGFIECGLDVAKIKRATISGCLVNNLKENNAIQVGELLAGLNNLDDIPSPYLNGMLDEFFAETYIPIIETNRSCPYECAYCAWGKKSKRVMQFSTERVLAEIEYISQRCNKTKMLEFADANFGLFPRDELIAEKVYECHEKFGYPGYVDICWNKSNPTLLLKIIKKFHGLTKYCAAMQTLHQPTLEEVKRRNISWLELLKMTEELKKDRLSLSTELILGLPLETKESHVETNRRMMDLGTEIFNYNLHLLPGTVLDTKESRKKFVRRTAWRLFDMSYGVYDGKKIFDAEENVIETSTMIMDDLRAFRFVHFLIQFMWSRKWYYDYLHLFKQIKIHPMDVIMEIAFLIKNEIGEMSNVYASFSQDHELELFDSEQALYDYWSEEKNFERLRSGDYGKLNYLYTYKILLEHASAFNDFLYVLAERLWKKEAFGKDNFLEQCREILDFSNNLKFDLSVAGRWISDKTKIFHYDLLSWRNNGYPDEIVGGDFCYEFYLPEKQLNLITSLFKQYDSHSSNLTLRKMSEQVSPENLFYQVRKIN